MPGNEDDKDKVLAEKAYEAAASSVSEQVKAPAAPAQDEPAAAKAAKPEAAKPEAAKPEAAKPEAAKPEPVAAPKVEAKAEAAPRAEKVGTVKAAPTPKAQPAPKAKAKPAPKAIAKAPARAKPAPKPKAAAPKPKPVPAAQPKPAAAIPATAAAAAKPEIKAETAKVTPAEPKAPVSRAAPKTAYVKSPIFAGLFTNFLLEENTMDMSANFNGIQEAMTEAQAKAKAAFEKSTAMLGEASDFAKGNVEAVMESGKILADGVQGLGSEIVAEGRAAFETMSGDIKDLAAAKSPADFFKIQGDVMRKNFDSAVAYGSKNSETMLKLMSDVMAPISGRVSVAMEKVRQTPI